jgi:uncharacterized membrane protein required for colicin V production
MNSIEISILVLALAPLLYRTWNGWRQGASVEVRYLLANLFGVLVAIRYWQPWTEKISGGLTFDPRWVAIASFVALYGLGVLVAGFVVRLKGPSYRSVKPDFANKGLGVLAGLASGFIAAASVFWLAQVARPGSFETVPAFKDAGGALRGGMQSLETAVGVAPDSTGRTRYPLVTLAEVPADPSAGAAPEGAVLMQQRGHVAWQP